MPVYIDAVLFADAHQEITRHPHLVSGVLRSFAENLELPLALRHFGVDAFVIDAGFETLVEMLFDDGTRRATDVLVTDASVVFALRIREAFIGETEWLVVLVEKILLFETEPGTGVVENRRAAV